MPSNDSVASPASGTIAILSPFRRWAYLFEYFALQFPVNAHQILKQILMRFEELFSSGDGQPICDFEISKKLLYEIGIHLFLPSY